jgi:hypothetical protein
MRIVSSALIVLAFAASTIANADPIRRLLIVGNSITWHTPSQALQWQGNWGMAASTRDSDFAHVLKRKIEESQKYESVALYPKNISDFENEPGNYDFGKVDFAETFGADTLVVLIGDNVKAENSANFGTQYGNLLSALQGNRPTRIYCVSTWWRNNQIDSAISAACNSMHGKYVYIGDINFIAGMRASASEHPNKGVAAHPSDAGMNVIATRIFKTMQGFSR